MIINYNTDSTYSLIGNHGTVTIAGQSLNLKRIHAKTLRINGGDLFIRSVSCDAIYLKGHVDVFIGEVSPLKPMYIDTENCDPESQVFVSGTELNIKDRHDIYNLKPSTKRLPVFAATADIDEREDTNEGYLLGTTRRSL